MSARSAIQFKCPQCRAVMRAPMAAQGRKGTCKQCQAKILVPRLPTTAPAPKPLPPLAEELPDEDSVLPPLAEPIPDPPHATLPAAARVPVAQPVHAVEGEAGFDQLLDQLQQAAHESIQQQQRRQIASKFTAQQIAAAFGSKIERAETSEGYRGSMAGVAAMMFMLPVGYLLLILTCMLLLLAYVVFGIPYFMGGVFGRTWIGLVIFLVAVAPAIAMGITLLFMIKPIFVKTRRQERKRELTRQDQPTLFALIDQVCEAADAPRPTRVEVNMELNASASLGDRMFSFLGDELVLTIGLPLFAALDAQQLAGVLAHEFGHFTQNAGMRATRVVRGVNGWFARLVYQRDVMDDLLEAAMMQTPTALGLIFALGQLFVWIARGILWCFLMVGHALSSALMRQMEFDADHFEIQLVGTDVFERTSRDMQRYSIAYQRGLEQAGNWLSKNWLVDDLTVLMRHFAPQVSRTDLQKLEQAEDENVLLSTHPTSEQRIEKARTAAAAGVFHLGGPATALVHHFESLCQAVTCEFYREALDADVQLTHLRPTAELLKG